MAETNNNNNNNNLISVTSETIFQHLENLKYLFHSQGGVHKGVNDKRNEIFSNYQKYNLENEKRKLYSWIENLDCHCNKENINRYVKEFKEEEEEKDVNSPHSRLSDGLHLFLEMLALKEYFLHPKNIFDFISGLTKEKYKFCQCLEKNRSHETEIDSASCLICYSCNAVWCLQCFEILDEDEEEEEEEGGGGGEEEEEKEKGTDSRKPRGHHQHCYCGGDDRRLLTLTGYLDKLKNSYKKIDKFHSLFIPALKAMLLTNYQDTSVFRNLIIKSITDKLFEYQVQICVKGGETDCLSFSLETDCLVNDAWK